MWRYTSRTLLTLLTLLAIIAGVWLATLQVQGSKLLSVQSGSMAPFIKKGDLITVNRVPYNQLNIGDVITFINPNNDKQTITHRVVALPQDVMSNKIVTKGDANVSADSTATSPAMVVGKVGYHVAYVGYALDFVRRPLGLILLIYIPALFVVVQEIRRLSQHYKSSQPYTLYGYNPHKQKTWVKAVGSGTKLTSLFLAACLIGFVVPARAALTTQATLQHSSISTALPPSVTGVLFKVVNLRCSSDNTITANKRPKITIRNNSNNKVIANNWHISDNSGNIVAIPNGFALKAKHSYSFTPLLSSGLQYAGDNLALKDGSNNVIDSLSWGTDTTAFNPSIAGVLAGTKIKRSPVAIDTNTAADWSTNNHRCHTHDEDHDHEWGDDDDDCGDESEHDRTRIPGWFNWREEED